MRTKLNRSANSVKWIRQLGPLLVLGCFLRADLFSADPPPATDQAAAAPNPVPPPSAPAKLSAAELEKLLMPVALYPDPLLATILPASVYPLEIVQAARFLADTNNASKIDSQSWDDSVKAVAKIPAALKKLNDDLPWTIQLGEAFLNQDKDVMDTIQALRSKAQTAGTLRTTEQQTIVVTNMVVETKVEQQVVTVTNTVVQIQPSNPQVVYVPSYPPTVYYPPPSYVYDPIAPLVTFTAGVAMGAIIANNCDWHGGGCYWGGGGDVNIERNTSINVDNSRNNINSGNRANAQGGKKWQPDSNRVRTSGSSASQRSMESRGWGSGPGGASGARASAAQGGGNRGQGPAASTRPAAGGGSSIGNRPSSTPSAGNRAASSPSLGNRPASTPSAGNRAASSPSLSGGNRPSASATPSASSSMGRSSGGSAFSGGGASDRAASARGSASRGGGGFGGGGGGGRGGGGRGGGGRR